MEPDHVQSNRCRRMARRQGYLLIKAPARDPLALGWGTWAIMAYVKEGMTLDQAEAWLRAPAGQKPD